MVGFVKGFYGNDLLLNQVIVLEFLDLVFLILHPKNARTVEIKGDGNFWHLKLPMQLDFILISIDFIEILVLQL